MADDDLPAFLASIPLFRGLPAEDIARLVRRAPAPKAYRPAARDADPTVIYSEGDASASLFILLENPPNARDGGDGQRPVVQVTVENAKLATHVRIGRVYPRNYFGDFEYLAASEGGRFPPRVAKAVPLSPCRLFELPYALLNEMIDNHPLVLRRLVRESMARFQQTLDERVAEKVSDPDIALANWLVERSRDFGIREGNQVRFRTAVSQEAIGKDLGVARETISLRLNEWRRRGLIASGRGQQLVVRDMERVERIAALALERSSDEHLDAVASVDAALGRGDNFRARNFALDVLSYFPGSAELKHRAALAVARCGATQEALGLLERFGFGRDMTPERLDRVVRSGIAAPTAIPKSKLDDFDLEDINEQIAAAGEKDKVATLTEDILALAPRLWKDLAFRGKDVDRKAAREAYDGYRRAFAASERPYTGVNAASLALLLGLPKEAEALTGEVMTKLPRRAASYWDYATKGETLLLRGDVKAARECFDAALACADAFEGSIAATRLQLYRLARAKLPGASEMLAALPNRSVAAYGGAMILGRELDAAKQDAATKSLEAAARKLIAERSIGHLYGGLRAGAEIAIAEAAIAEGARLHVLLPLPVDEYVAAAVAPGEPAKAGAKTWRSRFEHCLSQAASLTLLAGRAPPARETEAAFLHAQRYAAGQALRQSDTLFAPCTFIAAGDDWTKAALADAQGGDVVQLSVDWKTIGSAPPALASTPWRPVVFAWLLGVESGEPNLSARGVSEQAIETTESAVRAAAGKGTQVMRRMLGGNRPQCALVAVTPDASTAIELAEKLQRTNWPNSVAVQIALDFGPVLAANGTINEERLKDLDTGGGPLEAPESLLLASATFAAEARLALGEALSTVALGRVARLDAQASAVQLLPSTEIYALSRKS